MGRSWGRSSYKSGHSTYAGAMRAAQSRQFTRERHEVVNSNINQSPAEKPCAPAPQK
jgi:hypothetical protein